MTLHTYVIYRGYILSFYQFTKNDYKKQTAIQVIIVKQNSQWHNFEVANCFLYVSLFSMFKNTDDSFKTNIRNSYCANRLHSFLCVKAATAFSAS